MDHPLEWPHIKNEHPKKARSEFSFLLLLLPHGPKKKEGLAMYHVTNKAQTQALDESGTTQELQGSEPPPNNEGGGEDKAPALGPMGRALHYPPRRAPQENG